MTMTLSPLQPSYVTKKEFNEFKSYVHEGFEMTNKHIDNLEKITLQKFDNLEINMNARFAAVDRRFDAMDRRFDSLESRLSIDISEISKVVNKIAAKIL